MERNWKQTTLKGRIALAAVVAALMLTALPAGAATFGRVVPIGGQATDVAIDETRGVLYIANFTASRVDVMSLADGSIQTSLMDIPQAGTLSVSPNGRWLLVGSYGPWVTPGTPRNQLTLIDLNSRARQTYATTSAVYGVAFGADNRALVVTGTEFSVFDPTTGAITVVATLATLAGRTLPLPLTTEPGAVSQASVAASADGSTVWGVVETTSVTTLLFQYSTASRVVQAFNVKVAQSNGPRTISVSRDGNLVMAGAALYDRRFTLLSQFPNANPLSNVGSAAYDSSRGLVYAQVPTFGTPSVYNLNCYTMPTSATTCMTQSPISIPGSSSTGSGTGSGSGSGSGSATGTALAPGGLALMLTPPPVLQVSSANNLATRERLLLAENLTGKSVLTADGSTMYAVSDSGVTILPVGNLDRQRRLIVTAQELTFKSTSCDRRAAEQTFVIGDSSGAATDFSIVLAESVPGISITPSAGVTPATVTVRIDPALFANQRGTITANLLVGSRQGVNLTTPIRLLINAREPDQRGTIVQLPGRLVDILADPTRDRIFVVRQDTNEVIVLDATNYSRIATLSTAQGPTQVAISFDRRFLLVGHEHAPVISVFDFETLTPLEPVVVPPGFYPRSIASAGGATWAGARVTDLAAGAFFALLKVDLTTRSATRVPSLGVWANALTSAPTLISSTNGASIMAAFPDGNLLLYNSSVDNWTVSRRDVSSLNGAIAAGSDTFSAGNLLLNSSLVPVRRFDAAAGTSAGFLYTVDSAFRLTSLSANGPGVLSRIDLNTGDAVRPTRLAESPVLATLDLPFLRTLALSASGSNMFVLSVSGITAVAAQYDAPVAAPRIRQIVNAADFQKPIAPGGLVSIFGTDLSATSIATSDKPLPAALGESCLAVNGVATPVTFVSPTQINAQLPFTVVGPATLILRTVGGSSDAFAINILPTAPAVFRTQLPGVLEDVPIVVNARNGLLATGSNPVKRDDHITVYLTGMGRVSPQIDAGVPAPGEPLAQALVPPTVSLGGVEVPVSYAGLVPGQVGLYQINAQVLRWVPTGVQIPMEIRQGGSATTFNLRVID